MQIQEVVSSVVSELQKGRLPAGARRKPGRFILWAKLLDTDGQERALFLKAHVCDGRLSRIARRLGRRPPAAVERRNLAWASAQGIPVPRVVAGFPDFESAGFSVLVTEELSGMTALHHLIPRAAGSLGPTALRVWKRELGDEVARLTRLLHGSDCFHKDLYLCHFFLPDQAITDGLPIHGRLHLVDFLRLRHYRWIRRRWQVKDLAELLYSSDLQGIETRDRVRFLHAYLNCKKLDREGRRLLKSVVKKAERYRRKNRRRQGAGNEQSQAPNGRC
jgi:hypothetical protein